jgi:hypothetical protein
MQPAYSTPAGARDARGPYVCDAAALDWVEAGRPGLALKPVRYDAQRGEYLGLVGMEPGVRTGTHQHLGVASSFFLDGALTDYQGTCETGQVGINLAGATHDAIAYRRTLLVSRLEGPVAYLPEEDALSALHAGSHLTAFENPDPARPADINLTLAALPSVDAVAPGASRRMVFDYRGTGHARRLLELALRPGASLPRLRTTARVELWVFSGAVELEGRVAHANCFAILEPDTELTLRSRFGARLLVWAEGPVQWVDRDPGGELLGF